MARRRNKGSKNGPKGRDSTPTTDRFRPRFNRPEQVCTNVDPSKLKENLEGFEAYRQAVLSIIQYARSNQEGIDSLFGFLDDELNGLSGRLEGPEDKREKIRGLMQNCGYEDKAKMTSKSEGVMTKYLEGFTEFAQTLLSYRSPETDSRLYGTIVDEIAKEAKEFQGSFLERALAALRDDNIKKVINNFSRSEEPTEGDGTQPLVRYSEDHIVTNIIKKVFYLVKTGEVYHASTYFIGMTGISDPNELLKMMDDDSIPEDPVEKARFFRDPRGTPGHVDW